MGVLIACMAVFVCVIGCRKDAQPQPPEGKMAGAPADRHVALDGQPNFRDIGGYKTAAGRLQEPSIVHVVDAPDGFTGSADRSS